jgi:DNA-directed RNA polymerase I, II, and III subunit RPABC2
MSRKGVSLFEDEDDPEPEPEEDDEDDAIVLAPRKKNAPAKRAVRDEDDSLSREEDEDEDEEVAGDDDSLSRDDDEDSTSSRSRQGDEDLDEDNAAEDDEVPLELMRDFDDISEYESEDEDNYLQKVDADFKKRVALAHHPEIMSHNVDEVETLAKVVRDDQGRIVDPLHRTTPFITKYERARVIGERAQQINAGAQPLVQVDPSIIDGYEIALREFEAKKTPFIIRRPLPNGGIEYWRVSDLEHL